MAPRECPPVKNEIPSLKMNCRSLECRPPLKKFVVDRQIFIFVDPQIVDPPNCTVPDPKSVARQGVILRYWHKVLVKLVPRHVEQVDLNGSFRTV